MRSSFLIIWHFRICFSTFGKALISYKAILDVIRLIAYNDTDIKICRKIFSNDKYRRVVWQCNHKFDGGEKCATPHLDEDAIREFFVKAVNILLIEQEEILESFCAIKDSLFDLQSLETERSQLQEELNVAAELLRQRVGENARIAPERQELRKRYSGLENRLDNAQERLNEVSQVIAEKQAHRAKIEMFLAGLQKRGDLVTEFDEGLWYSLIEYVAVFDKEDIRFTFKDGTEIKVY